MLPDSGYLPEGQRGRHCGFLQKMHQAAPGKSNIILEPVRPVPILWDPDTPYLYTVDITLESGGRVLDRHHVRTGFRTVACTPGLFINNRKIKIMGLNRHQSFPYVGYAMGRRAQEGCRHLKNYLNANTPVTLPTICSPSISWTAAMRLGFWCSQRYRAGAT